MADLPFELSYTDEGEGFPIVLLHGFLESHTMWTYLNLRSHFRVIAIDLPGHGASSSCPEVTSIAFMADCLKLTLENAKIDDFHVIGHSMGGYVALEYLEKYGLSGHLILLNSNFWQDDSQKQSDRLRVANLALQNKNLFIREAIPGLFSDKVEWKTDIDALIAEAKQIPSEHIAACSMAMRNRKHHLSTIKKEAKKISILQGELDKICSPKRMETELERLNVNYICVSKAGHMSHIENRFFVRDSILKILSKTN